MSFGISAVGWLAIGTTAVSAISSADSARRAGHEQKDAINKQIEDDARAKAEAQTAAEVQANSLRVSQKRAYQSNALALGAGDAGAAGGKNVLSAGASSAQRQAAVAPAVSALGGGAPVTRSAGGY